MANRRTEMIVFLLFISVFFFTGCATGGVSSVAPPIKYELTLKGSIDGHDFQGIAVGSSAHHHDIIITSAVSVNYFTVQSCHRSVQFPDFIDIGWFDNGKSKQWSYDEAPTIEDTGDCILRFCAFSKTVGSPPVACSIVDFKSDKYMLPGENICNGADGDTTGTALCHTQVGLLERFRFPVSVVVAPQVVDPQGKAAPYWIKDQCQGKFLDATQTLFEYQVPSNECVIIFMEKAKPHRRAKLTVIPYDQPQYPGGK